MEYVTLANGNKVDWDEFSSWSACKQNQSINPSYKGKIFYKVSGSKVREWIKKGKDGFLFSSPPIVRNEPKKKGGFSGSNHSSARAVITPSGRFGTAKEAAFFLGISVDKLRKIIKQSSNGEYRYESESRTIRVNPNSIRIMTPAGEFDSINSAALHFGVSFESMRNKAMSVHMPEYYILDAPSI